MLHLQVWIWRLEGNDLYFEKDMPLRFKVQVGTPQCSLPASYVAALVGQS